MDSSKAAFSVMLCGNAEDEVVPPYVAPGARYNRSKSGWFDETIFTDWFFTLMFPILHKQEGNKVLIGDNLSLHLSQSVIDVCYKHNIAFVEAMLCLFLYIL